MRLSRYAEMPTPQRAGPIDYLRSRQRSKMIYMASRATLPCRHTPMKFHDHAGCAGTTLHAASECRSILACELLDMKREDGRSVKFKSRFLISF
jgi:hypothetical protein